MVISREGPPAYRQVAGALRDRIATGQLTEGALLPAEGDLAAEFGVGLGTIRKALAVLRAEGLVATERGYRTKVRERPVRERLRLRNGEAVFARMPTPEERTEHDLPEGVPVLVIGDRVYPADRYEVGR